MSLNSTPQNTAPTSSAADDAAKKKGGIQRGQTWKPLGPDIQELYYTTETLCELFGVIPRTLARWQRDGELPPYSVVGARRAKVWLKTDVTEWIAKRRIDRIEDAKARKK
jgi:predicted DNA-binding transcriptional regulator AlpA